MTAIPALRSSATAAGAEIERRTHLITGTYTLKLLMTW